MEELRKLEDSLGFKILFINWKDRLNETREIMEKAGCGIPVLLDCRRYGRGMLSVNYTPTTFIVDRKGFIRSRMVGAPDNIVDIITEVIRKI